MQHLRYPEDLFKVQRDVLSRYHITDPQAFYSGQDFWNVPNDPSSGERDVKQPPYYLTLKMPDRTAADVLADDDVRAAPGSEPGGVHGRGRHPGSGLRQAPHPAHALQHHDPRSRPGAEQLPEQVLRRAQPARPRRVEGPYGNLLTLPFARRAGVRRAGLRPDAAACGQEPYPILRRVLVAFGDKVGSADTLEGALDAGLRGEAAPTPAKP